LHLFFREICHSSRSRHLVLWLLGTLTGQQKFYSTGLVTRNGSYYHPLSVLPEVDCIAFCLKLLRICSLFFCFFDHVLDPGISEQFLRIFPTLVLVNIAQTQKIKIFSTLTSMNNFAKNWIWRRIFLCYFLFAYPLLYLFFFAIFKLK
jgi:hypothetical protein